MEDRKTKSIDLERIFTRQDYKKFKQAVENREEYEFRHSKPGTWLPNPNTGMYFKISGRKCDNGLWQDNYLYGIDTWRNNSGRGIPYSVDKILSYSELIHVLYDALYLLPPKAKQISLFDMIDDLDYGDEISQNYIINERANSQSFDMEM